MSGITGNRVYSIDRVIAEQALRIVFPVGADAPMHTTAPGKALLSTMDAKKVQMLLPTPLSRETANTLGISALMTELEIVQQTSIAHDCEEQLLGVCSFATPISTYLGTFAIGVVLPVSRLPNRKENICAALIECKQSIEARIGA